MSIREPGDGADRRGPQRRCIASGTVRDKAELLRFVVGPTGEIVPDPGEDLPGRGLWLRPEPDMIETARRRRLFARAARAPVTVPDDLSDRVAGLLRRRCLDRLGLARAAGEVVGGFEKVRALLQRGAAGVLLQACDAAPDGRDKLRRLAAATRPGLPVLDWFDSDELGRALGRERQVHVALRPGGHAQRLLREAARLRAFVADRGTDGGRDLGAQVAAAGTATGDGPAGERGGESDPARGAPGGAGAEHDTHQDERGIRAPERHDDE